jgi:hypothetical protein
MLRSLKLKIRNLINPPEFLDELLPQAIIELLKNTNRFSNLPHFKLYLLAGTIYLLQFTNYIFSHFWSIVSALMGVQ